MSAPTSVPPWPRPASGLLRREPVVASRQVDEPDRLVGRGEEVGRGVERRLPTDERVASEPVAGEERLERGSAGRQPAALDAVLVVVGDVVVEHETRAWKVVDGDRAAAVERGVVVDHQVARSGRRGAGGSRRADHEQEDAGPLPPLAVDVLEDVVLDRHPLRQRLGVRIAPDDRQRGAGVANEVVAEGDVGGPRPRGSAVLVGGLEQHGVARLRVPPVVLEHVALDQDPPGALELEQVLDRPVRARVARVADPPAQGLVEVVAPDLDVRGTTLSPAESAPPNMTFSPAPSR